MENEDTAYQLLEASVRNRNNGADIYCCSICGHRALAIDFVVFTEFDWQLYCPSCWSSIDYIGKPTGVSLCD